MDYIVSPYLQKEGWFEEFEKGSSIAKLSNYHKKDPRTIKAGIEYVRDRRLTAQVQVEVLKEGIRKHQEMLLEVLSKAADGAVQVPTHVEKLYLPTPDVPTLQLEGLKVIASSEKYVDVEWEVEQDFAWQLLQQHLGKVKVFRYLSRWKSALVEELNARLALKRLVRDGVVQEAGLAISENPKKPNAIRPEALYELTKRVFSIALQEKTVYAIDIHVDEDGVMHANDGAKGRHGKDDELAKGLMNFIEDIATGEMAQSLLRHHEDVDGAAKRARQALLEIALSYYIPGHCASCGKYSL